MQENQRLASEFVEENLANAQRRQLVNHHFSEPHQYSDGDLVLLHDPSTRHGASYKLVSPWIGPFTVVSNTGPVNYRIRPVSGGSARIVHYNHRIILVPAHPVQTFSCQIEKVQTLEMRDT